DDRRRHQAAARHRHDRLERAGPREPPCQRARVAMKLVPTHRKVLLRRVRRRRRRRHVAHVFILLWTSTSISSTPDIAAASFFSSRERTTMLVLGPLPSKNG